MSSMIEPGRIVRIHSLQSKAGKEMNGQRAAVLRKVQDSDRFEVKLEFAHDNCNATKAIKEGNLRLEKRLPLPTNGGGARGVVSEMNNDTCRKLCELLLWYRGSYRPPETMLGGFAGMAFMRLGQHNFMYFCPDQMEQIAGVLMLASMCKQGEESGTCDVLFALLEGDTMYVESLAQTLYWTGFIGPEDACTNYDDFSNCPPTALSPDQDEQV